MSPPSFLEFCALLGLQLEPGQRVLCHVAFDGADPVDLDPYARAVAARMFGPVDRIPPGARSSLFAVCGRASGKTMVLGAARLLHLASTLPLRLGPGQVALAPIVAPRLAGAMETFRFVVGLVHAHPALAGIIESESAERLRLRGNGGMVDVQCVAASAGGEALRGRSYVGAFLDEVAFFYDSSHVVNDDQIYQAIQPRLLPGAQVVAGSTPWGRTGLLWTMFDREWGRPATAMVAHAPTDLMRSDPQTLAMVARERARDPGNAAVEYDALFLASDAKQFFDEAAIQQSIDASLVLGAPPTPGATVTAGADFGFTRNSSALAVVHRYGDRYEVRALDERKPEPGSPLRVSATCAAFADVLRHHRTDAVAGDDHYREAVWEHLDAAGIDFLRAPAGADGKLRSYVKARQLMREGKVRLPDDELLIRQLRAVVSRPTSGGGMTLSSPEDRDGRHGDVVSALVLALWQAHGAEVVEPPAPYGTPAYWAAEQAAIEARAAEQASKRSKRQWWELLAYV